MASPKAIGKSLYPACGSGDQKHAERCYLDLTLARATATTDTDIRAIEITYPVRKSPTRDDDRYPRNQKSSEHDFAECGLIQFAIERPAEQRSGNKHR